MSINCAVIGAGRMGQQHIRVLKKLKSARLVAICDPQLPAPAYADYRKMLLAEKIEAVIISTPASSHYQIAKDCLLAKKHLLVEKPLAIKLYQAEQLIRLAKKQKLVLTVGLIERFNPGIIKLKQWLDQGKLGQIKSIIFQRAGRFDPRVKDLNVVEDISVHDLDLASFLLGKQPKKIFACGGSARLKGRPDFADILLDFGTASVHLQTNWITPLKVRRLIVCATKAYTELDLIKQSLVFYRQDYSHDFTDFPSLLRKSSVLVKRIKLRKQEPLKLELQAFIQAVQGQKKAAVTGRHGQMVLQTALKISKMIQS